MGNDGLRGGARSLPFHVKEAVLIPAESIDVTRDKLVLRVGAGHRDAVVTLDVPSYVSAADGRSLWEILIDTDGLLPKHFTEAYPTPSE